MPKPTAAKSPEDNPAADNASFDGFAGSKTLRQIADELGVSKQTVYKRYKGKLRSVCAPYAHTVNGVLYISEEGQSIIRKDLGAPDRSNVSHTYAHTYAVHLEHPQSLENQDFAETDPKNGAPDRSNGAHTYAHTYAVHLEHPQTLENQDFAEIDPKSGAPDRSNGAHTYAVHLEHPLDKSEVSDLVDLLRSENAFLRDMIISRDNQLEELNARLADSSAQMSDLTAALLTAQQTAQAAQALHAGTLQAQLGDGSKRGGGFLARLFGGRNRSDERGGSV